MKTRILAAAAAAIVLATPAFAQSDADNGHKAATSSAPEPAGAGLKPDASKADNAHSAATSTTTTSEDTTAAGGGGLKNDPSKMDNGHAAATSTSPK